MIKFLVCLSSNKENKYDLAIAEFDKTLEHRPDSYQAYYMRAIAYKRKGEKDRAISDFQKVLQLADNSEVLQNTKDHLRELGH